MKSVSRLAFLAVVGFCALLPTVGHAATFYNAGCTGSTSTLTCTFTALPGFAFQDSQAADISVSGVTSASETISGGLGATSSTVDLFPSGKNVDGIGDFTVTDDLVGTPPRDTQIVLTLNSTTNNLALFLNGFGTEFGAHVCQLDSAGTDCTSTFFATPAGVVGTPLPTALPLFAGGLGLVGWLARNRKRKAQAVA